MPGLDAGRVKARAAALGFELAGIASLGDAPPPEAGFYGRWLERGYAGEMGYLERRAEERRDPRRLLDGYLYADCVAHPNVARVVALSGGYSREEANDRLSRQNGMVASFSRALSEGLSAQQSEEDFNATLDASIASIAAASAT